LIFLAVFGVNMDSEHDTFDSTDATQIEAAIAAGDSATILALFDKQKEACKTALHEWERQYRTLAENSQNGIIRLDRNYHIIFANQAAADMIGSSTQELIGKLPDEFPIPLHLASLWEGGAKRVFSSGHKKTFGYEFDDLHKVHYLQISMIPEFGLNGAVESVLAITCDVSEQKKTAVALRESEERFRLALGTTPIIVYSQDGSLRYTWAYSSNPKLPTKTFLKHTDFDIFPTNEAEQMSEVKNRVLQTGQLAHEEFEATTSDGKIWLDITVTPLRNNEGQTIGITGVALDITDRKRFEEELENVARFPRENPNPVLRISSDGTILYANNASAALMDAWGVHPQEKLPEIWRKAVSEVIKSGKSKTYEYDFVGRTFFLTFGFISGANYVNVYGLDITERKRAEEALRESENRERERAEELAALLDAVPTPVIIVHDPDSLHMTGNRAADELLRIPRNAEISLSASEKAKPRHFKAFKDGRELRLDELPAQRAARGNTVKDFEFNLVFDDGITRTLLGYGTPLRDEKGQPRGAVHVLVDITGIKHAEKQAQELNAVLMQRNAELEAERARWQGVVEGIADEVWISDMQGKISLINLPEVTQMGLEEFSDKSVNEVLEDVDIFFPDGTLRPPEQAPLLRSLKGEIVRGEEIMRHRKTGRQRYRQFSSAPTRDATGAITGAVAIVRDITESKMAEERVRQLNENLQRQTTQLMASNRELEAFSYSISHNLRGPLRSIDGFSQILMDDYSANLDEQGRDYLTRIRASAQRMGQLIEDILTLSFITRKSMSFKEVNLSTLAQTVLENFRKAEPGRKVETIIPKGIMARGDESLLTMVMQNLFGNAWKYTVHQPLARIEFGEIRENSRTVYFVRDNGIGFDMQYAEKLYAPFFRLHTDDKFPGTGIGLAIAHRIIERHGGNIWAESELGKGATFYFTLGE
jgi:PAS domain S-box-containing protein